MSISVRIFEFRMGIGIEKSNTFPLFGVKVFFRRTYLDPVPFGRT